MMVGHELQDGKIIRDDSTCEAEFFAQQLGQDGGAACAGQTVDGSVGVHDRRQSGVADHGSERLGIDLTQLSWTHLNRTPVAPALRHGVAKEVLARGGHSLAQIVALETLDIGGPDGPREHPILAVGFPHPSPAWVTSDIEDGSKCVPGTDCHHLCADNLGHLLDEVRVPGRGQPNALGKDRRITVAEPSRGLLVDDDRNAEPSMFDGHLLNSVHERGTLLWMQASRGTDSRDLPDAVRHHPGDYVGVEGTRAHESRAPEADELGQLLVQGHEGEQVLDPVINGGIRVTVERGGHVCTPCCRFLSKNYRKADTILANSARCTQFLNWKDCITVSMSCSPMPLKSAANSCSSGSASRMYRTSRLIIHRVPKGKGW